MISPTEAQKIFAKKFDVNSFCKELDKSITEYLSSELSTTADYAVGYIKALMPEYVMENIASRYVSAGWSYVYYCSLYPVVKTEFKLSMNELNAMEAKGYSVRTGVR